VSDVVGDGDDDGVAGFEFVMPAAVGPMMIEDLDLRAVVRHSKID
jgi:hypothetical protein